MLRILKFETRYPVNKDPEDYVLIAPIGEAMERSQTWHRIKSIIPREGTEDNPGASQVAMTARWKFIGPAYEQWKAGNEIADYGTPLEAWAAVDAMQVETLKQNGIRTVEEAAEMTDSTVSKLNFPNARKLPKLAKDYLAGRGEAKMASELEEARERMAAMEEMLTELQKPKRKEPEGEAAA